jgi:hypothetical protein
MKEDDYDLYDFEDYEDEKVDEYASEIHLLLGVLGEIDEDLSNSMIKVNSKMSDFDLSDEELCDVSEKMGFTLKNEDNIVDIAKKIRNNS